MLVVVLPRSLMLGDDRIAGAIERDLGNARPPAQSRRSPAQFNFSPAIDEQLPWAVQPCGRLLVLFDGQLPNMFGKI